MSADAPPHLLCAVVMVGVPVRLTVRASGPLSVNVVEPSLPSQCNSS
jgi:hypothetical protein